MVEAYRRDASSKDQLISELKSTKKKLDSEVKELRKELLKLKGEKTAAEVEQGRIMREMLKLQQQMEELELHLQAAQNDRDEIEIRLQVCLKYLLNIILLSTFLTILIAGQMMPNWRQEFSAFSNFFLFIKRLLHIV